MKKLTAEQWYKLDEQFRKLPAQDENFSVTGEHQILIMVLRELGYNESNPRKAVKLAERLLCNGYN